MTRQSMSAMNDAKLKSELKPEETLVWQGMPETFKATEGKRKSGLVLRCTVSAVCFAVLTAAYAAAVSGANNGVSFNWGLELILLLVCVYIAMVPVLDARKICGKSSYYITDQRAITVLDGKEVFALPLAQGGSITPAGGGNIHLQWGTADTLPEKKLLVASFVPKKNDDSAITGFVFYNVKDSENLRKAAKLN